MAGCEQREGLGELSRDHNFTASRFASDFATLSLAYDATEGKVTDNAKANFVLTKPYRKGFEPTWLT